VAKRVFVISIVELGKLLFFDPASISSSSVDWWLRDICVIDQIRRKIQMIQLE